MDEKQLEALKKSIEHWKENVRAGESNVWKNASVGAAHCALCKLNPKSCGPCPVAQKTGRSFCNGTPYQSAHRAFFAWYEVKDGRNSEKYAQDFAKCAQDEVDFLESLLPKSVDTKET